MSESLPIRQSDFGPPDRELPEVACRTCRCRLEEIHVGIDGARFYRCVNPKCIESDYNEWIPADQLEAYLKEGEHAADDRTA